MPCFNSINFHQSRSKIKLALPKKYKLFQRWEPTLQPPDLRLPTTAGGHSPSIADFGQRACLQQFYILSYNSETKNNKKSKTINYNFFAIIRENVKDTEAGTVLFESTVVPVLVLG